MTSTDHGSYQCVVKNDVDVTRGYFVVNGSFLIVNFYYGTLRDVSLKICQVIIIIMLRR